MLSSLQKNKPHFAAYFFAILQYANEFIKVTERKSICEHISSPLAVSSTAEKSPTDIL